MLRCYFWPNCEKEIEDFVKTRNVINVGRTDVKKGNFKTLPIISEIFTRINLDGIFTLLSSDKNNRYLITSLCVASK